MDTINWRKSSHSGDEADCVEVAPARPGVFLRNAKDHGAGPVISFAAEQWTAFLDEVRANTRSRNGAVSRYTVDSETHLRTIDSRITLRFTAAEWAAFRAGVRDGDFDLPVHG